MRLKRLDIVGFKSFMDKTVIQFDKGITGVVGPNGCGKSNIVDAIRWVLGEQSPKHLRGASMSDVIFNGSQSRPPLGMAEVTLSFYNDDASEVPAQYRQFREIAVTRRLFRTGESEYQINKVPCRLMDITDLFLGTGVGTKAYSIIEQGRIGVIVSAKAEDRRTLIEEAAGITRYKAKKKAAERKMDHTRANLLRVGDLVGELGKRLDSLQRQAKKAERYKQLKAELQEIELHLVTHRWLEVSALRTQLAHRLEATTGEIAETTEAVATLETDLRRRRERLAEEEARLAEIQNRATEAEGQAKVHEERVSGLVRERESLDVRTREARAEAAELNGRLETLAAEREAAETALAELEALIAADREVLTARTEEASGVAAEVERLTGLLDAEREGALDVVRTLSQGKSHLEALERQRAELAAATGKADAERVTVEERIAELEAGREKLAVTVDDTRQLQLKLEEDRQAQALSLKTCRENLAASRQQVAELKDALAEKRSRLGSLQDILRNYEGYAQGVRSVMLQKDDGIDGVDASAIFGLVADVVHADPAAEQAVEAVLDARLQWVLVRDGDTARRLAGWLEAEGAGRGSFVALADLVPGGDPQSARALAERDGVVGAALDLVRTDDAHADLARLLLGDVVVVDDLAVATALAAEHPSLTYVTRRGEVLAAAGVLTGGTREGAGTGLLETRREVAELEEAVAGLIKTLEVEAESLRRLEQREANLDEGLARLIRDSHAEQLNLVAHETELGRVADELGRLDERLAALARDRAEREARLEGLAADAERTQAALTAAESDQATRQARVQGLEQEIAAARARHQGLQGEVTQLRVKAAGDTERRDAAAKDRVRLDQTRAETEARLAQLQGLVEGSGATFEDLDSRMTEGRTEAERLIAEAGKLRTEVARARETVSAASKQLATDEDKLAGLRARHEAASRVAEPAHRRGPGARARAAPPRGGRRGAPRHEPRRGPDRVAPGGAAHRGRPRPPR